MKRRNKILSLFLTVLLCLIVCLSFAACGEKSGGGGGGGSEEKPEYDEYYVTKIEVVTPPTNESVIGMPFDTEGMVIKATWNDGYVEENVSSTKYYVEPAGPLPEGTEKVTIYYGDASVEYYLNGTAGITGLQINRMPDKTLYYVGETFNPSGIVLAYTYDNGMVKEIENVLAGLVYDTKELTESDTSVTVTYEGYSVNIPITVIPASSGVTLEAEDAELIDNTDNEKDLSTKAEGHWMNQYASGGLFVCEINATDQIVFHVTVDRATTAQLTVRGASNFAYLDQGAFYPRYVKELQLNKVVDITVNDGQAINISDDKVLKGSGTDENGEANQWYWVNWTDVVIGDIQLQAGENTITFTFKNPEGYRQPYNWTANQYGDALGQYDCITLLYK